MAYRTLEEALTRGRGRERAFRCPVHGDSHASASVNVTKGLWVCYTCGAKGNTTDIIEGEDFEFGQGLVELLDEEQEQRIFPEGWLDLFHRPGRPHPYWLGRFEPATIEHFRLGYNGLRVHRGVAAPAPCYPLRNPYGQVLGVVYRQPDGVMPKYVYPRGSRVSDMLYGYLATQREHVLLVEGAVDAMACWEAGHEAWAMFGAQLSQTQLTLLHRAGVRHVGLVMDNDTAGERAVDGWTNDHGKPLVGLNQKLIEAGFETSRVDWSGVSHKDIAACPKDLRHTLLDPLGL